MRMRMQRRASLCLTSSIVDKLRACRLACLAIATSNDHTILQCADMPCPFGKSVALALIRQLCGDLLFLLLSSAGIATRPVAVMARRPGLARCDPKGPVNVCCCGLAR